MSLGILGFLRKLKMNTLSCWIFLKNCKLKTWKSRSRSLREISETVFLFYLCHLLKDVLVIYVLEHCDETCQFVLHLILCHSLCRFLQEIVTVLCQLHTRKEDGPGQATANNVVPVVCVCVCVWALTSSGALQMDFGSLKFTTDVKAWERETLNYTFS